MVSARTHLDFVQSEDLSLSKGACEVAAQLSVDAGWEHGWVDQWVAEAGRGPLEYAPQSVHFPADPSALRRECDRPRSPRRDAVCE